MNRLKTRGNPGGLGFVQRATGSFQKRWISKQQRLLPATSSNENHLTCPIVIETAEMLSQSETVPEPLWAAWCGSLGRFTVTSYYHNIRWFLVSTRPVITF